MRMPLAAAFAVLAAPALAACPSDEAVQALADEFLAAAPATLAEAPASNEDALCWQDGLVERLTPELGEPVGYKVGLTSKPAQERFGADGPVRGQLLESMILENGATVRADYGARPIMEADLLVTVRSDEINVATTIEEVLRNIESVQPFIELADLVVAEDQPLDPNVITAINVGARLGVAGRKVPARSNDAFRDALAEMSVSVAAGEDGAEELASVPGKAILGHPLEAVLWLMNDGVKLEAGDVVSLGSFGAPLPVEAGRTVTATYMGLSGDPKVSVTFE